MLADAVRAEQIRVLYQHSLPVLGTTAVNAVIIAAALWTSAPKSWLVSWVALTLVNAAARLWLFHRYRRARPALAAARVWGTRFMVGSFISGLLWGASAALFFDSQNALTQLLISFVIGGMGAGAAGTISCYLPAFAAYILPSVLPLFVRVLILDDPFHVAMAVMILVYGAGLAFVAGATNRALRNAFRLRCENEELLANLARAQETLRETNRTLEEKVAQRTAAFEQQSEALRNAQRMEAVGRLAGGVAHDFNNFLTVVLANTSLLLEDHPLDRQARTAIEEVRDAAERGADLIRQLLAFGRRQRLAPVEIDLGKVVLELRPLLERLITPRIAFNVTVPEHALRVLVDRSQIEQVLVNLTTNARDAMPDGGRIDVSVYPLDGVAVLSIQDTGSGMDETTRQRAFEPFFTTKQLGRGTGLGLATVHGIVEQSGGRIEVSSTPGAGTRFDIFLPVTAVLTPTPPEPVREAELPQVPATSAIVLLVEDDRDVRAATRRLLRYMGHEVLEADSGEQALAVARAHPGNIDLLISDVVMTGLSGPELAEKLTTERPELRALLISGYSWERAPNDGGPREKFEFLQKPFSADGLAEKVGRLLGRPLASPGTEVFRPHYRS